MLRNYRLWGEQNKTRAAAFDKRILWLKKSFGVWNLRTQKGNPNRYDKTTATADYSYTKELLNE